MLLNLTGKKILVTGIANNRSIAWGIAQQLSKAGAELGITYLPDDKGRFESKVRELTEPLNPSLFLPLDVQNPAQIEDCLLYTSPSPRDQEASRMPSSA